MTYKFIAIMAACAALTLGGCKAKDNDELGHHHNHSHSEAEGHDHEHEGHDHPGEDHGEDAHAEHGDVITLSPDMAERLGVKADTVAEAPFGSVLEVSGVIESSADAAGAVSARTAGIFTYAPGISIGSEVRAGQTIGSVRAEGVAGGDPNRVAKVELDAAKAELDRITPLWEDRLVTRAQYNAAVAAYQRALAAYSAPAASGRVTAPVSGVITTLDARSGQFVETGTVVATVNGSASYTLRADVPARKYALLGDVTDARVVLPYSGRTLLMSSLKGRRAGTSAAAARSGYVPVTFTFAGTPDIVPGTAVDVYLLGPDTRTAISVPRTAIVEQQGDYYVYEKLDEDCYRKLPVSLGATDGERVEVLSGLHPGMSVVTAGTTAVTLAAASGNIPEGHSHSH